MNNFCYHCWHVAQAMARRQEQLQGQHLRWLPHSPGIKEYQKGDSPSKKSLSPKMNDGEVEPRFEKDTKIECDAKIEWDARRVLGGCSGYYQGECLTGAKPSKFSPSPPGWSGRPRRRRGPAGKSTGPTSKSTPKVVSSSTSTGSIIQAPSNDGCQIQSFPVTQYGGDRDHLFEGTAESKQQKEQPKPKKQDDDKSPKPPRSSPKPKK